MRRRKIWSWLLLILAIVAVALWFYPPGKFELRRRHADAESSLRAMESLHRELGKIPADVNGDTTFQRGAFGKPNPENAAFVHAEDLTDLATDAPIPLRFCESQLKQVAFLVRNGQWNSEERLNPVFDTPGWIDDNIDYLAGLKYLFVIRRQSYDPPKIPKMGGFESGNYSGDVLLFEIPSRKLLGRLWINGSNTSMIESHETPEQAVLTNLGNEVGNSLDEEVTTRFPAFTKGPDRFYATCSMY
jgi:hypothetical protein